MSADNGIYIVKFPDGYRITHAQAIENIDYYPEGSIERKNELKSYFGESEVYNNIGEAAIAAEELSKEYEYLEYGITIIPGEFEAFK